MQYAEISEVWDSPLSNKIKEMEDNQRAFYNQSNINDLATYAGRTEESENSNNKLVTNAGYIMPAGSSHAEPIRNYLKNDALPNPNRLIRNRVEETRVMDAMDDDLEEQPRFISSNVPKQKRRTLYKKRDYVHKEDDYYKEKLNKIYKNQDEGITCDRVEEHMKKCFYCHEKYKKNDNFTVTLDPKNILLISILVLTILFVVYHIAKK